MNHDLGRSYVYLRHTWKEYLWAGGPGVAPSRYAENVAAATIELDQTYLRHGFDPDHILEIKAEAIRDAKAHLFF